MSYISDSLVNLSGPSLDPIELPLGLPLPFLAKNLVALTGDRHLQVHSYLLEFSESLCVLGNLPRAIQAALTEAVSIVQSLCY